MGILATPQTSEKTPTSTKRKSAQIDFSALKPLKPGGTVGFVGYRDNTAASSPVLDKGKAARGKKKKDEDAMDSDADDEEDLIGNLDVDDGKKDEPTLLSPDEARGQGELAEGVRKIKVRKRLRRSYLRRNNKIAVETPAFSRQPQCSWITRPQVTGTRKSVAGQCPGHTNTRPKST